MGKIIQFPVNEEETNKLILLVANNAIADSTNEMLLDSEEIEERISNLRSQDTMENRVLLITGMCFYNDAYVVGGDDWEDYEMQGTSVKSYAVFTSREKMPKSLAKKSSLAGWSFRILIDKLNEKNEKYEIYINPGKNDGYIFTSDMLKVFLDLIDKATDFADEQMKKGYKGEDLTDIMFERFDYRNVEITLKDGSVVRTEVEAGTFGDDPNARYTYFEDDHKFKDMYIPGAEITWKTMVECINSHILSNPD